MMILLGVFQTAAGIGAPFGSTAVMMSLQLFLHKFHDKISQTNIAVLGNQSLTRINSQSSFTLDSSGFDKLIATGPVPRQSREYLINGWRWHTKAVLRDLSRFKQVIRNLNDVVFRGGSREARLDSREEGMRRILTSCYEFVCDFNWNALMKVEAEIFYPWLSTILQVEEAKELLAGLYQKHAEIRQLSSHLKSQCGNVQTASDLTAILTTLDTLTAFAESIQTIQVENMPLFEHLV